jgi:hypothetical protein
MTKCCELYGCTYEITYDEEGTKKYKMNGLDKDKYMYYFTEESACNGYGVCCHKRYGKKTFKKNKLFNINTTDISDIVEELIKLENQ